MHLRSRGAGIVSSVALVFAVVCASAPGQMDLSNWPKVQVELLITGAKDPLAGPAANNILLREDGKLQAVLDLQPVSEPQSVCILIDSSGSMYSRMKDVQTAAAHLLQILPAGDEICLASFQENLHIRKRFTRDRTKIATGIQAIRAQGGTSLRDALLGVAEYMRASAKNRQRAILVLTDGGDNASDADEQQMRRLLESPGSPVVHVVRVPPPAAGATYPSEEAGEKKAVQRITSIGGGLSYFPGDAAEMNASLDNLNAAMQRVYLLTYTTATEARDGRERQIQIGFARTHDGSKFVAWAPERYYAPSQ